MGKLKIRRSGKVELDLGNCSFLVQRGADCLFSQRVAVVSEGETETTAACHILGDLLVHCPRWIGLTRPQGRLVVTPDMDSLLPEEVSG